MTPKQNHRRHEEQPHRSSTWLPRRSKATRQPRFQICTARNCDSEQNTRLKTRHQIIARCLIEHQHLVRPSNQWMFPDNSDPFLETGTAVRLGTWIASRHKTVKNHVKMAEKESSRGTANIISFFTPTNPDSVAWMRCWRQDNLIHD